MGIFSIIRTLLLCAASLTILVANPSSCQCNNHLLSGERLNPGQSLTSGNVDLAMQYDCNLVLYDNGKSIWSSDTYNSGSGCYVAMQTDGNLVIYDNTNKPLWASNTGGENGNYILILQKDRNLVIYSHPIWATGTNYAGSVAVVVAAARNGTVGISGAEQNKVSEIRKILKMSVE